MRLLAVAVLGAVIPDWADRSVIAVNPHKGVTPHERVASEQWNEAWQDRMEDFTSLQEDAKSENANALAAYASDHMGTVQGAAALITPESSNYVTGPQMKSEAMALLEVGADGAVKKGAADEKGFVHKEHAGVPHFEAPGPSSDMAGIQSYATNVDNFKQVEANLRRMQAKIARDRAKLHTHTVTYTAASSLLQTIDASSPDDGFSKVEAKLKALEEKMKADAAKFEAEAKAPSSFVQTSPDKFEKGVAKIEALPMLGGELKKFINSEEEQYEDYDDEIPQAFDVANSPKLDVKAKGAPSNNAKGAPSNFIEGDSVPQTIERFIHTSHGWVPASFAQTSENPDDGFAKVEAKLKALQEKIKADTAKFEQEAKSAPSSFVQVFGKASENPDDGFAKVEAKLKALQEKIKADTTKFEQEAKAAPSSFAQTRENPDDGFAKVEAKLKALQEKIKADTAKFEQEAKAGPSSFLQNEPGFGDEEPSKDKARYRGEEKRLAALAAAMKQDFERDEHKEEASKSRLDDFDAKEKAKREKRAAERADKLESESLVQLRDEPTVQDALSDLKAKMTKDSGLFDKKFKPELDDILDAGKLRLRQEQAKRKAADEPAGEADANADVAGTDGSSLAETSFADMPVERKLEALLDRINKVTPSSLAQVRADPESLSGSAVEGGFNKVEAKLKALQEKIKADTAKFEQDIKAGPSSFAQTSESPDDSFAKVEAKLKALQDKIKADTAKFEQEAKAAPSSFVQTSPDDGFAKVEAKLKALQEKIKADTAKFEQEAKAAPSSFVQTAQKAESALRGLASLHHRLGQFGAAQKAEYLRKLAPKAASSLLQSIDSSNPDDGFAKVEAKLKALQEKIKADTAKFDSQVHPALAQAAASSLLQEMEDGRPDVKLDKVQASLKALELKIKADTAAYEKRAYQQDGVKGGPMSFAQLHENPSDDGFAKVEAKLKALQEKIKADTAKFEQEAKAAPSSLVEEKRWPEYRAPRRHHHYDRERSPTHEIHAPHAVDDTINHLDDIKWKIDAERKEGQAEERETEREYGLEDAYSSFAQEAASRGPILDPAKEEAKQTAALEAKLPPLATHPDTPVAQHATDAPRDALPAGDPVLDFGDGELPSNKMMEALYEPKTAAMMEDLKTMNKEADAIVDGKEDPDQVDADDDPNAKSGDPELDAIVDAADDAPASFAQTGAGYRKRTHKLAVKPDSAEQRDDDAIVALEQKLRQQSAGFKSEAKRENAFVNHDLRPKHAAPFDPEGLVSDGFKEPSDAMPDPTDLALEPNMRSD